MAQTASSPQRRDVHREITDHIIAAIEKGAGDFEMPWHREVGSTLPTNALTANSYNGVNVIALWATAELRGYASGLWATYKQWRLLDAQVRKGEKGSIVVFYKQMEREVASEESGEAETKTFLFARASYVFNADQVDGWRSIKPPVIPDPAEVLEHAESFVAATRADIRHGGDRAYYKGSTDHIQMPLRDRFTGTDTISTTESYYATLFHELAHWTGHKKRLDRNSSGGFAKEAYAMEELVAELGAAFLCSELAITNVPRPDHAAYVESWLKVLREDNRAIFRAASQASKAANFILAFRGTVETAQEMAG